jgi:hypothetical protein
VGFTPADSNLPEKNEPVNAPIPAAEPNLANESPSVLPLNMSLSAVCGIDLAHCERAPTLKRAHFIAALTTTGCANREKGLESRSC